MGWSEDEISTFIVEQLRDAGELTGSSLRALIQTRFPDLDFKAEYGGLKQFISANCADKVQSIGFRGMDVRFALKFQPELPASPKPLGSPPADIWRAFTNPQYSVDLIVARDGSALYVDDGQPLTDGLLRVRPVTKEEYRIIARDFLDKIENPLRDELQQTLLEEDFWPKFSQVLNINKRDGILNEWLKWRKLQICDLFTSRLADMVSTEAIEVLLNYMTPEKKPRKAVAGSVHSGISNERGKRPRLDKTLSSLTNESHMRSSESELRDVLHQVIDIIEESDLRRIWLPVGAVLDAMKKKS